MISLREVSLVELEREEDCCNREPAIMTIVKKTCCDETHAAQTTTFHYDAVGAKVKQGLSPDCLVEDRFQSPLSLTSGMLVENRFQAPLSLTKGTTDLGSDPGTFQPPNQWLDWVLEVVSQTRSFRDKKPSKREICHLSLIHISEPTRPY